MTIRRFIKKLVKPDQKQSINEIKEDIKKEDSISGLIKQKKEDLEFEKYIAELERKIKTDTDVLKIQPDDYISSPRTIFDKQKESLQKSKPSENSTSPMTPREETPIPKTEEVETVEEQAYQPGTILKLDDGTIGIYKQAIPNKEYDLIYVLNKNGKIEPRGMVIFAYECQVLGNISDDILDEMQKKMMWKRDEIVFHLDKLEYAKFIPSKYDNNPDNNNNQKKMVVIDVNRINSKQNHFLQRGRKISISVGDRAWESIYWGEDDMGPIVAHHTSGEWNLMHLDLKRFGDSVRYKEVVEPEEIRKIESVIKKSIT